MSYQQYDAARGAVVKPSEWKALDVALDHAWSRWTFPPGPRDADYVARMSDYGLINPL
jgi:hypothetical protein